MELNKIVKPKLKSVYRLVNSVYTSGNSCVFTKKLTKMKRLSTNSWRAIEDEINELGEDTIIHGLETARNGLYEIKVSGQCSCYIKPCDCGYDLSIVPYIKE